MSEEAYSKIREKLTQVRELLEECTVIADENNIEFYLEGPTYGAGAIYYPDNEIQRKSHDPINDPYERGWQASSQGC